MRDREQEVMMKEKSDYMHVDGPMEGLYESQCWALVTEMQNRETRLENMLRKEVASVAQALGIRKGQPKDDLIRLIVREEQRIRISELRMENRGEGARVLGFASADSLMFFEWAVERLVGMIVRADVYKEKMAAEISRFGILHGVEASAEYVKADASGRLAFEFIRHCHREASAAPTFPGGERMTPEEAFRKTRESVLIRPLLKNQFRGGSSSAMRNAVEEIKREACADMVNDYRLARIGA